MTAWVVAVCNLELSERYRVLHIVSEHLVVGFAGPIEAGHKAVAVVHILAVVVVAANLVVPHRAVVVAVQGRYTCMVASIKIENPLYGLKFSLCLLAALSITFLEGDYKRG